MRTNPRTARRGGEILTFPDTLTTQRAIPMVFQHSGGRDFDLFPDVLVTTQGLSLYGVST
jgi:hypothetical protein